MTDTDTDFYCNFYVKKSDLKQLLVLHELELSEITTNGERFNVWAYANKEDVVSLQKSTMVYDFMFEDTNNSPFI